MIDLATLTGSTVRALGYSAAGMFSNNQDMVQTMTQIGLSLFERVWPLPLYEEFDAHLHSDIADIRNFSGLPIAGAISAAKFIEAFTEKHGENVKCLCYTVTHCVTGALSTKNLHFQ